MLGSVDHGLAGTSPPLRPCRTLAPTGPVLPIVSGAAFALASLYARPVLRRIVGGETMTAPGGAGTLSTLGTTHIVRAWTTGFSHKVGAFTQPGLRPFALASL